MACDPNTLLEQAKCINACIPQGMMKAVNTSLLCQILSNGGGDDTDFTAELLVGLIHYWKLEDLNDSIGSFILNDEGIDSFSTGKHNNACFLQGGGDVATDLILSFSSSFTVSAWFYVPSGNIASIVTNSVLNGAFLKNIAGRFKGQATLISDLLDGGIASFDLWHLVVFTYDGGMVEKFSIDGGAFVSGNVPVPPVDAKLAFSSNSGIVGYDEVGFWTRALTQTDVNALWNNGNGRFLS